MRARLLNCDEVAQLLGVSHWSIRSWINRGDVRSVKLGRRRLILSSEVDRIISEGLPSLTAKAGCEDDEKE